MYRRIFSKSNISKISALLFAPAMLLSFSGCGLIAATAVTAISLAPMKLMFACLPEGTAIDTPEGPRAIEGLRAGDIVMGFKGEPVKIQQIHGYLEDAEKSEFYAVEFSNGTTVKLCSMHRIGGVRAKNLSPGDYLTEGESVVKVTTFRGVKRSYDIVTEDEGYQIGGIPVNSMIEEMYQAGSTGKVNE